MPKYRKTKERRKDDREMVAIIVAALAFAWATWRWKVY